MGQFITLEDVRKTPKYYIDVIISETRGSYVFYNFAPYLTMIHLEKFLPKETQIKNPELAYLVAISQIKNATNSVGRSAKEAKEIIRNTVKKYADNEYIDKIEKFASNTIEDIRRYQHENHIMESAMLNYAPIVQYGGTLVKSELSDLSKAIPVPKGDQKRLDIEQTIHDMLIADAPLILENNQLMIDPHDIAQGIIDITNSVYGVRIARLYFLYVYLRFVEEPINYDTRIQQILKLNTLCNNIHKGEKTTFSEIIGTLESLISVPS